MLNLRKNFKKLRYLPGCGHLTEVIYLFGFYFNTELLGNNGYSCQRQRRIKIFMKKKYTVILLTIPILYFYLSLFRNALVDDVYITLSYVKTILNTGTWGIYPDITANTATSPLNIILLTLVSFLTGSPVESAIILTLVCFVLILFFLTEISLQIFSAGIYGFLCGLLLIFNPLLLSTIGLESFLFIAIFIISLKLFISKRWNLFALSMALLTLSRADGILIFIICLFFVPTFKNKGRLILLYFLFVAPWYLSSWIWLGSFVPETLILKKWQNNWWGWSFSNGLYLYYKKYFWETILSFSLIPFLLFLPFAKMKNYYPVIFLAIVGLMHFIAYCLLHVPPFHWYYTTEVAVVILISVYTVAAIVENREKLFFRKRLFKNFLLSFFIIEITACCFIIFHNRLFQDEMPIHTNWAKPEQYKQVGLWLKKNYYKASIFLDGELGAMAYYSDCYLWNEFTDRSIIAANIKKNMHSSGLRSVIYKINFVFFPLNQTRPEYSYRLKVFKDRNNIDENNIKKWKTSSRWFPNSLIVFSKY